MMNIEQAEMLHVKLRQELPGDGDARSALSTVVELHAPVVEHRSSREGNFLLTLRGVLQRHDLRRTTGRAATIIAVNAYAHVEGLPTS
jgi:hypothetical protein